MLREQKYTAEQVDGRQTLQLMEEFNRNAEEQRAKVSMPATR